jgi:hypothetical protein
VVVFPATVDRLQIPFMTKRAANNNKEKWQYMPVSYMKMAL